MKKIVIILIVILTICTPVFAQMGNAVNFVNPFIGTDDMGHVFPGAAAPFGMVQLSPETDSLLYSYGRGYNREMYRYCSGYQYNDNTIVGFSHTHFNGTGHSDLGDFLIMPTVGKLHLNPGTKDHPAGGYRSRFSHAAETASPGYYRVMLEDYNILAELTATERTGFHKYTFPASEQAHLILDLTSGIYNYDGKVVWASIRVENDTLITGYRQTSGWARTRYLYFAMTLSKPIASYQLLNNEKLIYSGFWRKFAQSDNFPERAGRKVKAHFDFSMEQGEVLKVKFALSAVSTANALENLRSEIPGWNFEKVRASVRDSWSRELSRIAIKTDEESKINFYTSLYHTFLSPIVYSDVNGQYRGLDQNIHKAEGFTNYTIFSLWDTYRALHPLFTIIQQKRTNDIVRSMLAHYKQSVHHILPVWSHHANENWCMIGYHAVSVIADAFCKGIDNYDAGEALEAMKASSNYDIYDGIKSYKKYGYVPEDHSSNSASKTLEYAYDDFAIAKMAEKMGRIDDFEIYMKRAANYKNIFDAREGFLRARLADGSFKPGFDPMQTHGQGYIEGNAWNYSLYVPQDIKGFINLIGGDDKLISWLDGLFVMKVSDESIAGNEDITRAGMIGNYVHGNEPSHHVPYMYNYAGKPWKTQERINEIMTTMYKASPDGLCGNDDCGQMSAWYVFSALGFYPVCPGASTYIIGKPCVEEAEIHLENGRTFMIKAENLSSVNIYIRAVTLNGRSLNRSWISHQEVMDGGKLIFKMGSKPNKQWAATEECRSEGMSREQNR